MKKILTTLVVLFSIGAFAQADTNLIVGIYEGEYWYKNHKDTVWIKQSRVFLFEKVVFDGSAGCYLEAYSLPNLISNSRSTLGQFGFITEYSGFCDIKLCDWCAETTFYKDGSFFTDHDSTVLGNPFRIMDYRYYGKKIVTGIEDKQEQNQNKLYPNPAQDYIILPEVATNEQLDLYNSQGVKQESPNAISQDGELQIDVSRLENGLYLLKVEGRVYQFLKE